MVRQKILQGHKVNCNPGFLKHLGTIFFFKRKYLKAIMLGWLQATKVKQRIIAFKLQTGL